MRGSANFLNMMSAGLLLFTACAVGPDYHRPALEPTTADYASAADSVRQHFDTTADIPAQWWELLHSSALNELVTTSLKNNPGIVAAEAALRNAREAVYAQQGAYYPAMDAGFQPTRQKVPDILTSPLQSGAYLYTLHTAQVNVSYVPDIFGLNRRQVESLVAQAEMQRFQLEAAYLTLTSNIVVGAIQEASLRAQIAATREMISSQDSILTSFRKQFNLGQISEADVAAQEALCAQTKALLPGLEKQLSLQRDQLIALAGRFPNESIQQHFELDSLQLPAKLPLTLPSKLVENRPDIRAAEEQMHAASALVGVAVANRLPDVTLGVNTLGTAAGSLSALLSPGTDFWALTAGITQPIFEGGTLLHRQRGAEAAYDQAAALYRETVVTAFQNVADALQAIHSDADALQAALNAVQATDKSLSIAKRQFALSDISRLVLLNIEQTSLQARINLIQCRANQYSDAAALFQALGGGWWNRSASKPRS